MKSFNTQMPALYGLANSNHDFSKRKSWGKNIFNNTFPVALACYMNAKGLSPVYFTLNDRSVLDRRVSSFDEIFGMAQSNPDTYFSFETAFVPYQPLVIGTLPRADLVVMNQKTGVCASGIEIKLTALPDNSTFKLSENRYGCEIVIRPDTIVYLALSIANIIRGNPSQLSSMVQLLPKIADWTDIAEVTPLIPTMANLLEEFMKANLHLQHPLMLQPIWKTEGKRLTLHRNAFDIFVWSNFAFTRLFFREALSVPRNMTRGARSVAWLFRMLFDFASDGKLNHRQIIDSMSFNTRNDKAFATNGMITQSLMASPELLEPRVKREELKNIILGGGEQLLSPERRLDAAILNTPGLFS